MGLIQRTQGGAIGLSRPSSVTQLVIFPPHLSPFLAFLGIKNNCSIRQ